MPAATFLRLLPDPGARAAARNGDLGRFVIQPDTDTKKDALFYISEALQADSVRLSLALFCARTILARQQRYDLFEIFKMSVCGVALSCQTLSGIEKGARYLSLNISSASRSPTNRLAPGSKRNSLFNRYEMFPNKQKAVER